MNRNKSKMNPHIRSFLIAALAFCLLTALTVGVYHIPMEYTLFETNVSPISDVSEEGQAFLAELDEQATIYWLCEYGTTHQDVTNFLAALVSQAPRVSIQIVDTVEDPDFAAEYTAAKLSNYSFIVESEYRYQVIDFTELFYFVNEYINYLANTTYKLSEAQYAELYKTYGTYMDQSETREYFQGESLLLSAIDYVTTKSIPHAYVLTGYGDREISPTLREKMSLVGVAPEKLSLSEVGKIPEDAGCIILFAPQSDLSANDTALLKDYINNGGAFLLISGLGISDFDNLASVCALFGMHPTTGVVVDTNSKYYRGETHLLTPLINSNHAAMYAVGSMGYPAYMPNSMSIKVDSEAPKNVTTQVLLGTSESGLRVSRDSARTPLCDPAAQIVAACGTLATVTADGTTDNAYFAWFASEEAFTDEAAAVSYNGNYFYLAMTADWMSEKYTSRYASLAAVDLTVSMLEGITMTTAIIFGILTVVVLPLGLTVTGLVIWLKRRNR